LRLLTLKHCQISSADHVVSILRHHQLHRDLVGLDLSYNKLDSLRFLFQLRSDYGERLLFLGLANNPITKKPDYREQVRGTLPNLIRLDGECIRRPPLALPYGTIAPPPTDVQPEEYAEVLAVLRRFLYAWETQQVPRPPSTRKLRRKSTQGTGESGVAAEEEEDRAFHDAWSFLMHGVDGDTDEVCDDGEPIVEEALDVDTLPRRYLHPDAYLSITVGAGCQWFDESLMRDAIAVDGDTSFDGHRLSGLDVKELRVMDTSMRNHSRNLVLGKTALHRIAVGRLNAFTAYQSTLYPTRMMVQHHMEGCRVRVSTLGREDDALLPKKQLVNKTASSAVAQRPVTRDPYAAKPTPHEILAKMMAEKKIGKKRSRDDAAEGGSSSRGVACGPAPAPPVPSDQVFAASKAVSSGTDAVGGFTSSTVHPLVFIVDLHGVMSWRSPTMHGGDGCIRAAYHRTLTLVHRVVPRGTPKTERRLLPGLVIQNDMITLMPPPVFPQTQGSSVLFNPLSEERLARVAVEYGLDGSEEGQNLVRRVAERSTTDACLHDVLSQLVGTRQADEQPTDSATLSVSGRFASLTKDPNVLHQRSQTKITVASSLHNEDYTYALDEGMFAEDTAAASLPEERRDLPTGDTTTRRQKEVTLADVDWMLMRHVREPLFFSK